jgi:glycosyltransferase involved in cell wall biosynthesis
VTRAGKPHVLVLVDEVSDRVGGAERFAVGVACQLPRDRFEVSLCATHVATGALVGQMERAGVRWFALERRGRFDLARLRRLTRFLRAEGVDVLHSHKIGSNLWGSVLGRLCRVPVVIAHEHTWSYQGNRPRKLADGQLIGRLATRFVSVSNADRLRMIELEGVPAEKAITVPTAYVPRAEAPAGDLRAELGIPAGDFVVGTVAVLRRQKALDVLIEAFARLGRDVPDSWLVIVGDGPERATLEEAARAAGVPDRVRFTGGRGDLTTVLDGFDVAVMSSDFEGLPLFVFECMAHRVPLVATAVGGLPDVVEDGATGVLVPPRDPAALAAALSRLAGEAELRLRLADAAHERLGDYTLERAGERFAALYEELLAAARAERAA